MHAPWFSRSFIIHSSRALDTTILQSWNPASSSIFLAFLVRNARSPESRRIAHFPLPVFLMVSLNALMALGIPLFNVSYVSTSSVALSGYSSQNALNASYSESNICTQEWAMVPLAGTPYHLSVTVHAVPPHPAMYAALAPSIAASVPCARLEPNSRTVLPAAALTMRLAFVAISV